MNPNSTPISGGPRNRPRVARTRRRMLTAGSSGPRLHRAERAPDAAVGEELLDGAHLEGRTGLLAQGADQGRGRGQGGEVRRRVHRAGGTDLGFVRATAAAVGRVDDESDLLEPGQHVVATV